MDQFSVGFSEYLNFTTKKHTTYIILPLIPFGKLLETFSFGKLETFFLIMMLLKSWVKDTFSCIQAV